MAVSYMTAQREVSQQLRTIRTSAFYNIPLHSGCAEQSVRVAEDNGTMSLSAGCQANTLVLLHPAGWQGMFRSHAIRCQSPHGLAVAGLCCAIQMWDILKEFETPPRCLLKAA